MAEDATLESLKIIREQAFQNMQKAYDQQQDLWERKMSAQRRMNDANGVRQYWYSLKIKSEPRYRHYRNNSRNRREAGQARAEYNSIKDSFSEASKNYRRCRRDFEQAAKQRADELKRDIKSRKRAIAESFGVPDRYSEDIKVVEKEDGESTQVYFGGGGTPDGVGHGHYVMDKDGNVVYHRDPFEPHGPWNFSDYHQT